jgi:2-polyprenyl-6-hydroxyphenyl methylase/3-demethylubiquinone-9 3-methyltransferase
VTFQARETYDLNQAEARLPETTRFVSALLLQLQPLLPGRRPLRVLDVGSAQGVTLVILRRLGYEPFGVEPWEPAVRVAEDLAAREHAAVHIRIGTAERIPYEDGSFDLVLASSVMEHVEDLRQALAEIHRVLRPGGVFWFFSASSLCPKQSEIRGFPLFSWYPSPVKRRIMGWASVRRPELVGGTTRPAVHWWTPRKAHRELRAAGFAEIWGRWQLKRAEELQGPKRRLLVAAKHSRTLRLLLEVAVEGCAYAARKPA